MAELFTSELLEWAREIAMIKSLLSTKNSLLSSTSVSQPPVAGPGLCSVPTTAREDQARLQRSV